MLWKPLARRSTTAPGSSTRDAAGGEAGAGRPETSSQASSRWRSSRPSCEVADRCVVRHLAVAVGVDVPEADVASAREPDRARERLLAADHAVDVEVRERDVARVHELELQREAALAALGLGLQCVELPVGDVLELDLVADVVLARELVDAPAGLGVRHPQPRLREGTRGPEVEERAAATVRDPQARVLAVPAAREVGIGRVRVVVRVLALAVEPVRPVAAQEADVVHHRARTRHPPGRHRAGVDAVRVEPDADHDRGPVLRRLEQRLGRAGSLEGRRAVGQHELGRARVQAHEHAVGPQPQRVGDDVSAERQVDRALAVDRVLQRGGVVGRRRRLSRRGSERSPSSRRAAAVGGRTARAPAGRRRGSRRKASSSRRARRGPRSAVRARRP